MTARLATLGSVRCCWCLGRGLRARRLASRPILEQPAAWQRGPVLVGLCEACEHAGRGAYHLDTDGCCSVCSGPFLADVELEQLAAGEDAPNTFRVDLDAAIRHPLRQEAPHA